MKIVRQKLVAFSWKFVVLLAIFVLIHNAQSAINSDPDIERSDIFLSTLDSVKDSIVNVQENIEKFNIKIGGNFGVIISVDGYILTVSSESMAANYEVTVNGTDYTCFKVGWQEAGGIALYKIATNTEFAYATIRAEAVAVGEQVFALGNSLGMLNEGSELRSGRIAQEHHFINTCPDSYLVDMNTPDGFTGCGMFDSEGQLLGIAAGNVKHQIYVSPINSIMRFVDTWLQNEGLCYRGTIDGLGLAQDYHSSDGAHVIYVTSESQADKLGIKVGSIITKLENEKIGNSFDFWNHVSSYPENHTISIEFKYNSEEKQISAKLSRGTKDRISKYSYSPILPTVPDTNSVSSGKGKEKKPAYLGISADNNLDRKIRGIPIHNVVEGSPASAAGLIKGDIILTANGQAMYDFEALEKFLDSHNAGDEVDFEIQRGKDRIKLKLVLSEKQ